MKWLAALSTSLIVLAAPDPSRGQDAQQDPRTAQARALFEAGRIAFENANYEDALRHFRDSYEISGRPALLYNIGVAADRLRRDDEALEAFESFLRDAPPDAPQRADVEVRVRVLREQRARPEDEPEDAAPPPARGGDTPAGVLAGWGTFGGGLAVVAAGAVLLGLGQADADTVANAPEGTPYPEVRDAVDRASWMRVTGWVLAGVGLAAAAAGLVLVFTTPSGGDSVALELGLGRVALAWRTP